jgi:hypothetical protein
MCLAVMCISVIYKCLSWDGNQQPVRSGQAKLEKIAKLSYNVSLGSC